MTGKADKHELPAACAEREAFEETGLRGHLVDLEFCHRYEHKQRQVEEYAFLLRVPRGSEPNISNEHVSARWAGPKEALKVLEWEAHREALARALKALQHGG